MAQPGDEESLLRAVALQNASAIQAARRRVEEELQAKTRELARTVAMMRATLDAATDGILVTDDRRRVTDVNARYLGMWRLSPEQVAGVHHDELVATIAPLFGDVRGFHERLRAIYAEAPAETFDVLQLADGRVFERSSRVQVVDGRQVGRVWTFRDVTEHRRLLESERAARAAAERASAMKDEFLATLSHELRTPLSAILGWSQMLRQPAARPGDLRHGLEIIERNARMQTQLIEDLLDMSRIASGQIRIDVGPVRPAAVIELALDTVRAAADAKGIELRAALDPAAGPVSGDPGRIQQVVWNLLSNAIKFTGRGGTVTVRAARVASHVEISVEDTGIGIAPDFLPYVFERFRQADGSTTRASGGLGLGLAIVKQLVELHGGTVHAASGGADRGATFTVSLPLMAVEPAGIGPAARGVSRDVAPHDFREVDLTGVSVVVVDDEPDARELVAIVLGRCGARVVTAGSAAEALAAIEDVRPHVLVSDIGMPAVDGYELLRRVRELGGDRGGAVPAIALTAFARSEERTLALRAGYLVHLPKPVEPTELAATVAAVSRAGR
jgi:PAS domain S-box-containing protein